MSAPRVLVVDDEADIRRLVQEILIDEGYAVDVAADAEQARASRAKQEPDLVLLDIWMPGTDGITLLREWAQLPGLSCPVVMMSGHGTVETAVEATRLGAFDFVEKPLSLAKLLRTVKTALEVGRRKRQETRALVPQVLGIIGRSGVISRLREQVQRLAPHDTSIMIVGERGTGKQVLARYIHGASARASQPFISLVAGSVTDADAAEILFGVQDGVQAAARAGVLGEAHGGTLFIDDVRALSPVASRLLINSLERRAFTRVGGRETLPLDVRVICSTESNSGFDDLVEMANALSTHLNAVTIQVPAVREYAEDVPELLRNHAESLVDEERLPLRRFGIAAQNRLRNYPWPGNVRELRNLVRRLLILGGSEEIALVEVEREVQVQAGVNEPLVKQDLLALPLREARDQFERAYLQQQLILCNGKVGQLAKRVGIERTHLYRKLRALGVDFRQLADD